MIEAFLHTLYRGYMRASAAQGGLVVLSRPTRLMKSAKEIMRHG